MTFLLCRTTNSIAAECFRAQLGPFSPNLIDQSSCRMDLVLACVIRILHDDGSIRLRENRPDGARKHLAAMLLQTPTTNKQSLLRGYADGIGIVVISVSVLFSAESTSNAEASETPTYLYIALGH